MVKKTTKFHWNGIVADSTLKFIAINFIDFCIFASTLFAALFLGVAQLTTASICACQCMLVIGIESSNVQYIQIFRNELNLFTCFCSFSLFVCRQISRNSKMNATWQKELNDYLSSIERYTTSSLRKIQTDFSSTGTEFDKKFRKNFLRITNNR